MQVPRSDPGGNVPHELRDLARRLGLGLSVGGGGRIEKDRHGCTVYCAVGWWGYMCIKKKHHETGSSAHQHQALSILMRYHRVCVYTYMWSATVSFPGRFLMVGSCGLMLLCCTANRVNAASSLRPFTLPRTAGGHIRRRVMLRAKKAPATPGR